MGNLYTYILITYEHKELNIMVVNIFNFSFVLEHLFAGVLPSHSDLTSMGAITGQNGTINSTVRLVTLQEN